MNYSYEDKKIIANAYLDQVAGTSWDDLEDINSLHDAESVEEIQELCDARLKNDGFPDE